MSLTLAQFENEVQARSNDTSTTAPIIDRWINLAVGTIASRADWPWLIATKSTDTTTSGTAEYTLPTDYKKMLGIRVGTASSTTEPNATELSFIRYEDKNQTNLTNVYYINPSNSKYGFVPTPATTGLPIYLKYFKIPATLSASTDTAPWPSEYDELAVFFALARYWELADEFSKSAFYTASFENLADRMKLDLFVRASGDLGRMKDYRELMQTEVPTKLNAVGLGR